MWLLVDKHNDIVVGSYSTRRDARASKRTMDYLYGKNYRMEHI